MNQINHYVCRNGMRIVHEKMPYAHSVSIGIWIKAGSINENKEEAGLAHFVEHMLFKGTNKYSSKMIAEQFDWIGGELNAYTSKEETVFYTTVLKKDALFAMELFADMLLNSTFDEEAIEKEKEVVFEEIAMYEDAPEDVVHELLWKTMYPEHPIGLPILGTMQSIQHFTKKSIQTFMARLYDPKRTVISIAGNYENSFIHEIESLFSTWVSATTNYDECMPTPHFQAQSIELEKDVEQGHLCIGYPTISIRDERKYELTILNRIVGSSMSSRLFQEIREKASLAYSIYSYYALYDFTGAFIIYGGTNEKKLPQLEKKITDVLMRLCQHKIDISEIMHAKQSVLSSFLLNTESTFSRMSRNGHQQLFHESNPTIAEVKEKIKAIQLEHIELLMKETFNQSYASAIIRPNNGEI